MGARYVLYRCNDDVTEYKDLHDLIYFFCIGDLVSMPTTFSQNMTLLYMPELKSFHWK